jgi:hypothetical protein
MDEMNNSPGCERASDLIAFLYDEANESEKHDFELHLKECAGCRAEAASFGVVRGSIAAWRDEALSGFVATPLPTTATKKSALVALRQFFDLSPLWLKGATALAALALVLLAALAIRTERGSAGSHSARNDAIYTQHDVDRMLNDALAKQSSSQPQPQPAPEKPAVVVQSSKPKRPQTQFAKSRRPLTRAERDQLAADLRLLSTDDGTGLNLLGDRINQ